jgi:hypothetical protein
VALFFALLQQFWKNRRDAYTARIDEFCKLILEAADQAAEYWITKKSPSFRSKLPPEQSAKVRQAETKLEGFQHKVNLFHILIRSRISASARNVLVLRIADFMDAMTGGSFGAEARSADPVRARLVYSTAADLVAALRATSSRVTVGTIALALLAIAVVVILALHPFARTLPSGWTSI